MSAGGLRADACGNGGRDLLGLSGGVTQPDGAVIPGRIRQPRVPVGIDPVELLADVSAVCEGHVLLGLSRRAPSGEVPDAEHAKCAKRGHGGEHDHSDPLPGNSTPPAGLKDTANAPAPPGLGVA